MTLGADSYGGVVGVQAYIRHMTLDAANNPTTAQVEQFLDQQSARLNGWLAAAGYAIPVAVLTSARLTLDYFANIGAAGLCELAQRGAGYSAQDQNKRENKFLAEFDKAEAFINSGALAAMGAAVVPGQGSFAGLLVGGKTRSGQPLRPIFTRTMFGNDPTKESSGREPPYDE